MSSDWLLLNVRSPPVVVPLKPGTWLGPARLVAPVELVVSVPDWIWIEPPAWFNQLPAPRGVRLSEPALMLSTPLIVMTPVLAIDVAAPARRPVTASPPGLLSA